MADRSLDATGRGITIQIQSNLGHLNLRGNAADSAFVRVIEKALGQKLPTDANTSTSGTHRVYWLGPDEWLILTEVDEASSLCGKLEKSLSAMHAAVNDVSGGQLALRIAGTGVRDVLAKGCTLDLHPRVFTSNMCAQSGLAKASVLISLVEEPDVFDIVVRRSFADYLLRWLDHASLEFGTTISAI